MDGFEALLIHVSVDLGGRNVSVTEQFLDDPKVGPVFEEVCCEGMTKQVGIDVLIDPGLLGSLFDDLANTIRGKCPPPNREKNVRGCLARDEIGTLACEVAIQSGERLSSDRDQPGFVALAGDTEEVVVDIKKFEPGIANLRQAKTRSIKKFQECQVSFAELLLGIDRRKQLRDRLGIKRFREFGARFWGQEGFRRIDFDVVPFLEKAKEDLQVNESDTQGRGIEVALAKVTQKGREFIGSKVPPFLVALL